MLIVICLIIAAIMMIFSGAIYLVRKEAGKSDPDYFLQYMEKADSQFSFLLRRNGEEICSINEKEKKPAAGAARLLIAAELAKQAAEGKINLEEPVCLKEIDLFYIRGTDGGAHQKWLAYLEKQRLIRDGKVTLLEAGRGMMQFNSNASTDYLLKLLTAEQVNASDAYHTAGSHDPLYHFGSGVLMPVFLEEIRSITKEEAVDTLEKLNMEEYRNLANEIAGLLAEGKLNHLKEKGFPVPERFRRLWSDRLPGCTAEGYGFFLDVLNSLSSKAEQAILNSLIGGALELPANRSELVHAWQIGGSASSVLAHAVYVTDRTGYKTEAVFLAANLQPVQQMNLSDNMNAFMQSILTSEAFRGKLKQLHGNINEKKEKPGIDRLGGE